MSLPVHPSNGKGHRLSTGGPEGVDRGIVVVAVVVAAAVVGRNGPRADGHLLERVQITAGAGHAVLGEPACPRENPSLV